mgnify:CR=1 FL=1
MGFHLYFGNDANALLKRLAGRLRAPASADRPLASDIVLVPQFGLRRWLEIRLAEEIGIIANVDFVAPAEYAWRLLRAANPALAHASGYEREVLRWRVFALLAPLARESDHAALAVALGDDDQGQRLRLADALAHEFERDLAYRAHRLAEWERGAEAENWRAELWRRLVRTATQPHRAHLLADWHARFDREGAAPPGLPMRLSAFACANISPDLLRFYGAVSRHTRVDFYLPTPCREYWGDVRDKREALRDGETLDSDAFVDGENPALAAWGRAGRDLIDLLYSCDLVHLTADDDISREPEGASLLARVQRDVLDRRAPDAAAATLDESIRLQRCHSPLREVQALHDYLLDLFAHDTTLVPRDIVVMAPDIAAYAPHIESVFGGIARDDARHLPYALSDAPLRQTHPLIDVALRLFALPASRFELAEIGEWLTLPALQRRFGFGSDDALRLIDWLRDAGVRWGLDASQRNAFGAGEYDEFSWRFGLRRLLLGYASGEQDADDVRLIAGIAPEAAVEGTGANLLDAILRILDALAALKRRQSDAQTAAQWQATYNDAFEALFDVSDDRDAERALERVRAALADLAEETAQAAMSEPLDWRCLRDELVARLGEPERAYRFFSGGITLCGMVPLRAVPFRVVCLIGVDEGAFPRRDRPSPFELARERRGEPSLRDEDRYLFLQQLMAAREKFYVSWVGENARDGSKQEPSAVVAEWIDLLLRDYLRPANGDAEKALREQLIVTQPLQPFSPRLFDGAHPALFTYAAAWAGVHGAGAQPAKPFVDIDISADTANEAIDWGDWKRFWRNPAQGYLLHTLDIDLPRAPEEEGDDDDLVLSALNRYGVFHTLFDLHGRVDAARQREWLRASARLPIGAAGDGAFDTLRTCIVPLAAEARERIGDVPPSRDEPFELRIGEQTWRGTLPQHHAGLIVRVREKEIADKHLLDAWLDYLLLAAQRDDARLVLLEWNDKKGEVQAREAQVLSGEQARTELSRLAEWFARGHRTALPFAPKAAFAYAQRRVGKDAGHDAAIESAQKAYVSNDHHFGDDANASIALVCRDAEWFDSNSSASRDFGALAMAVYGPALRAFAAPAKVAKPAAKPARKSKKARA